MVDSRNKIGRGFKMSWETDEREMKRLLMDAQERNDLLTTRVRALEIQLEERKKVKSNALKNHIF